MYISVLVTITFCSYMNTNYLNTSSLVNTFFCKIVPVICFYISRKHKKICCNSLFLWICSPSICKIEPKYSVLCNLILNDYETHKIHSYDDHSLSDQREVLQELKTKCNDHICQGLTDQWWACYLCLKFNSQSSVLENWNSF
jgi:hypothetical protein